MLSLWISALRRKVKSASRVKHFRYQYSSSMRFVPEMTIRYAQLLHWEEFQNIQNSPPQIRSGHHETINMVSFCADGLLLASGTIYTVRTISISDRWCTLAARWSKQLSIRNFSNELLSRSYWKKQALTISRCASGTSARSSRAWIPSSKLMNLGSASWLPSTLPQPHLHPTSRLQVAFCNRSWSNVKYR